MRHRNVVAIAALAALLGCSSDATGPNPLLGQLLFGYAGGISGNFSASAAPPTTGQPMASYVAGQNDVSDGMVYALASIATSANVRDFVIVAIPRSTPGNSTIDASCTGVACAGLLAIFSQNESTGSIAQLCSLDAGTVTITTLTATRATGSFSGTGTCESTGGASTAFTVTGGTFDVALVADTPDT